MLSTCGQVLTIALIVGKVISSSPPLSEVEDHLRRPYNCTSQHLALKLYREFVGLIRAGVLTYLTVMSFRIVVFNLRVSTQEKATRKAHPGLLSKQFLY